MRLYKDKLNHQLVVCISQRVAYEDTRLVILSELEGDDYKVIPYNQFHEGYERVIIEDLSREDLGELSSWKRALSYSLDFLNAHQQRVSYSHLG